MLVGVSLFVLAGTSRGEPGTPPLAVAPFDAEDARAHQEAWAEHLGVEVEIENSVGMQLRLIPPGEVMMGSAESAEELAKAFQEYGAPPASLFEDEHPRHRVRITRPFYLGVHEVTLGQFRQFVEETGYRTDAEKGTGGVKGAFGIDPKTGKPGIFAEYSWRNAGFEQTDEHPVVNVSWNDAVEFCRWLSRKEGKTYRLPTEAEWEYACRAGTTTRHYHGDDPEDLAAVDNVGDATFRAKFPHWDWTIEAEDGYVFTSPVGKFEANAFGLYDMHGNVWEWCADWYDAKYYANSPVDDPPGPASGSYRVGRGGSWGHGAASCRSADRNWEGPVNRNGNLGFRLARTP
ncbi:MAG: formylglycine-generating enzyme family protein [Planctomycetaceae bacterium]|nr:MAG: formylglycine-generating enzyme family protein [Planctomycetaceae bacterium]